MVIFSKSVMLFRRNICIYCIRNGLRRWTTDMASLRLPLKTFAGIYCVFIEIIRWNCWSSLWMVTKEYSILAISSVIYFWWDQSQSNDDGCRWFLSDSGDTSAVFSFDGVSVILPCASILLLDFGVAYDNGGLNGWRITLLDYYFIWI